jgi:hypothetical protein
LGPGLWEGIVVQDFRTRLVCPECGESDNSELTWQSTFEDLSFLDQGVARRCLLCEHVWWVDWSPRPAVGFR